MNNYFQRVDLGLALNILANSNWTPCLRAGGAPRANNVAGAFGRGVGVACEASEGVDVFGQVVDGWAPPQTIDNINTSIYININNISMI